MSQGPAPIRDPACATPLLRRRIRVRGVVQGVGFRPFVFRVATELGLAGSVCNDGSGVAIDAQGESTSLHELTARLEGAPPPLARIDAIEIEDCAPEPGRAGFAVTETRGSRATTAIGHDTATCPKCLAELFDPGDRRYRYAFTNCTECGPRYTVTRSLPYDRIATSLAPFPLCAACQAEYVTPDDRRFHAEATACPQCGPRLALADGTGDADPIAATLSLLRGGSIVAIKGLGGYHLACDARSPSAVARLRARKAREEQPFAIMAANAASLEPLVVLGGDERALLESAGRPIVLLRRRPDAREALPGIADGCEQLGVMLPYTPIHFLLWHEAANRPRGTDWLRQSQPLLLVMTSANAHGEPLVTDDAEALDRLTGIADAWLLHDRAIVTRCDDSVMRVRGGRGRYVRRARGAAPRAVALGRPGPVALGLGGYYKVTACVTRGAEAFLTPHIGDLDVAATRRALDAAVEHLLRLTDVRPALVAHDLHPDFYSGRLAARLAAEWQVPLIGVQHHHAHVAAVLAEHRIDAPVLGLALDGIGFGTDGGAWGGELLRLDGADAERLGHLRTLPLVGGDRAAREPWRMAAAALHALGRGAEVATRFAGQPAARLVIQVLEREGVAPRTSSLGRWFDAAAGLLGLKAVTSFEGQAAMLLEGQAARATARAGGQLHSIEAGVLDLLPLLAPMVDATDVAQAAADFHAALARALGDWVQAAAIATGIRTVACGGGCFQNDVLSRALRRELDARALTMLEAEAVPPNDGAISLGQCWVAQRTRR
ncbi:MAG TPA: carbamoyltransferase HypF [Steroidobacteraceae bacterium]|nr:carbamoyltransferase HypF [Steroidobacteraceae bacterium]